MRIFLYKCIMELNNGCAICAFLTKIMRDFPFLCANCALRGPNIITGPDHIRKTVQVCIHDGKSLTFPVAVCP